MNAKRILALVVALLMLVVMFSACSNDAGSKSSGDASDKSSGSASSSGSDEPDEGDAPEDKELWDVSWIGVGDMTSTAQDYNFQDCVDGKIATFNAFLELAANKYNLNWESYTVPQEIYVNTIQSLATAGELPSGYFTYGRLDDATVTNYIEQGMLQPLTPTYEYSDGTFTSLFCEEDGAMRWAYAMAQYTDGDWYYVPESNNPGRNIQITEVDGKLRAVTQVHGAYSTCIRLDWLNDLGLSLPTNVDEFYNACHEMNAQDVNGNGLNDERVIFGLGTKWQYQGAGNWYGLPYYDFADNPSTGEVMVSCLLPGYADWATYMAKFYKDNMLYVNEGGHTWTFGTYFSENNVICWTCMQDTLLSSGHTNTGDEDCAYEPMDLFEPLIDKGIRPGLICQEATACEWAWSFRSDIEPQVFAAFNDLMYGFDAYLLYYYGIEGEAWWYDEDGTIIEDSTGEVDASYEDALWCWGGLVPIPMDAGAWDQAKKTYTSYQEMLDAGEPFNQNVGGLDTVEKWLDFNDWDTWDTTSPCAQMMQNVVEYGEENIDWQAYYTFPCPATTEQLDVLANYGPDLNTYIIELGTKLITGEYSVDQIDELVATANDTYHLGEYVAVMQERYDRFRNAMGLD